MPREIYVFDQVEQKLARAIAHCQRFGPKGPAKQEVYLAVKITAKRHGGLNPRTDILSFPKDFRHARALLDYITEKTGCQTEIYYGQHLPARYMTFANTQVARIARRRAEEKAAAAAGTD